jgi:uncharacterized protein (DUF1800 family)
MGYRNLFILIITCVITTSFCYNTNYNPRKTRLSFPYKKMGLNKRQAAVHLLNRFTFGIKPGDVELVESMGLENWFENQLYQNNADDSLEKYLSYYDAIKMSNEDIVNNFIPQNEVRKLMKDLGILVIDSNFDKKEYKVVVDSFMKANNLRLPQEYQRQLINQKILRAIYSNNQLREVLTDFWFNHFNVSLTKNQAALYILSYERDVIRPNVLGNFEDLVLATAKSPAMLEYLDNNFSVSFNNTQSNNELERNEQRIRLKNLDINNDSSLIKLKKQRRDQGLNENYARELLELHTMGVDAGYTQKDVNEVAKIFTGWSIVPLIKRSEYRKNFEKYKQFNLEKNGFVIEGDFMFKANRHDNGMKEVLGIKYDSGGGYNEGLILINRISKNPNTAKFICKKIATKFVSDTPEDALIEKMAKTYINTNGNLREVLITMVNSTYFWDSNAVRKKIKNPFELSISAIRATNSKLLQPYQIFNWCNTMGQKFYYYQAPTGFPDRSDYWVNTNSLINRMNFGISFSSGKIPGLFLDPNLVNFKVEPESIDSAINLLSYKLLPENSNNINNKRIFRQYTVDFDNNKSINLSNQIVGLLIGSPEFQKK